MKVTKIKEGIYKVVDSQGTWIARGGYQTESKLWTAFDCESHLDCSDLNNLGVDFKTFKQ